MRNNKLDARVVIAVWVLIPLGVLALYLVPPGVNRHVQLWGFMPLGVLTTLICAVGFFFAKREGFAEMQLILSFGGGVALWTLGFVLEVTRYISKHATTLIQAIGVLVWVIAGLPWLRAELKKHLSRTKD